MKRYIFYRWHASSLAMSFYYQGHHDGVTELSVSRHRATRFDKCQADEVSMSPPAGWSQVVEEITK